MSRERDSPGQRPHASPPWSPRESELLSATLHLLQQHGYEHLTMQAVAALGHASKATLYRRWPSKADLVLAAVVEGGPRVTIAPNTGALQSDLRCLGTLVCQQARQHKETLRAVLAEVSRNPSLKDAMQHQLINQWKLATLHILQQAVDRGEIEKAVIDDELWDLLPSYLMSRYLISGQPPTQRTVETLVDNVVLPGLKRRIG